MSNLKGAVVTWLGHSVVQVRTPAGTQVIIDPFLEQNPSYPKNYVLPEKLDLILVTHGHFDHIADAPPLRRNITARLWRSLKLPVGLRRKAFKRPAE